MRIKVVSKGHPDEMRKAAVCENGMHQTHSDERNPRSQAHFHEAHALFRRGVVQVRDIISFRTSHRSTYCTSTYAYYKCICDIPLGQTCIRCI